MVDSIKKRFRYLFNDNLFKAITYSDPSYKNFEFINDPKERFKMLNEAKDFIQVDYFQLKSQVKPFLVSNNFSTSDLNSAKL